MDALLFLCREAVRALFHVDLAVLLADVLSNLRKLLPADCHHLHQKGRRVNAVLAVDMALHRQTTGGLAADDGIGLLHLCGNVLKAHRHLVAFLVERLRTAGPRQPRYLSR